MRRRRNEPNQKKSSRKQTSWTRIQRVVPKSKKARRRREATKPANWSSRQRAACPKLDFLDCLKAVAERAGLEPENFWLHKFRATYATWALWDGVDLRTVQQWLGHKDMESTMRYLKPSRSQQVKEKANEIFARRVRVKATPGESFPRTARRIEVRASLLKTSSSEFRDLFEDLFHSSHPVLVL